MRQHIVAQRLRAPQPRAMADHQPAMRAEHRQVIRDRLGVGRADADIDHRDPVAACALQVIGGHLRQLRRIGPVRFGAGAGDHFARLDQFLETVLAQHRPAILHEAVDIALVVREQDEGLNMRRRRPRIVAQPRQREIRAQRVEQRQRAGLPGARGARAVGDRIVDPAQFRQREHVLQPRRVLGDEVDHAALDDERQRHARRADPDMEGHAVMFHDRGDLVAIIVREQVRPRQRRAIGAGFQRHAEGLARVDVEIGALDLEARPGVARLDARRRLSARQRFERRLDRSHPVMVNRGDPFDRRVRIVKALDVPDARDSADHRPLRWLRPPSIQPGRARRHRRDASAPTCEAERGQPGRQQPAGGRKRDRRRPGDRHVIDEAAELIRRRRRPRSSAPHRRRW
jgi:hypothetical protein